MTRTHLIVRPDHIICTNCFKTEPVHCGNGTPMDTLWLAHEMVAERHQKCVPLKAGQRRAAPSSAAPDSSAGGAV